MEKCINSTMNLNECLSATNCQPVFEVPEKSTTNSNTANTTKSANSSKKLTERPDKNTKQQQQVKKHPNDNDAGNNLIVNYIPMHYTERNLFRLFSSFGYIENCKIVRSKLTGTSLGYGFVCFEKPEEAKKARAKLNGSYLEDKKLKVSFARPSRPEIKDANLYVGGIPREFTERNLTVLFQEYGEIISCRVIRGAKSELYHFGFVRFDTHEEAYRAMQQLNGRILPKHLFPQYWNGKISYWEELQPLTIKFAKTPLTAGIFHQDMMVPYRYINLNRNHVNLNRPPVFFEEPPIKVEKEPIRVEAKKIEPTKQTSITSKCGRCFQDFCAGMYEANKAPTLVESKNNNNNNLEKSKKTECNKILVAPIPVTKLAELELYKIAAQHAMIEDIELIMEEGTNLQYALIYVSSYTEAVNVVKKLDKTVLFGSEKISAYLIDETTETKTKNKSENKMCTNECC